MSNLEKNLLLFWRARLTKRDFKKTKRGKRQQIRGNLPKYGCRRRNSSVLVTQKFQSFVMYMRWRQSSSLDSEDCEVPSFVEIGENNSYSDDECLYCSGLYTSERRRRVDQMHKMLQVVLWIVFRYRRVENVSLVLLQHLINVLPVYLHYNVWQNIFLPVFQ